ncbi:hypothetical protein HGRIS_009683 [Hohenbuehelia grisea]|uniref:DUF803-domain-containing protein n=1 Tax=Hohenbuehelia grisea TaxID=104357 RepID=A0ABR3J1W8_9AGAR
MQNLHLANANRYSLDDLPKVSTSTFIGITVAIAGNVLISLALNIQKLAHQRVEAAKLAKGRNRPSASPPSSPGHAHSAAQQDTLNQGSTKGNAPSETQPLIASATAETRHDYGSAAEASEGHQKPFAWLLPLRIKTQVPSTVDEPDEVSESSSQPAAIVVDIPLADSISRLKDGQRNSSSPPRNSQPAEGGNEGDYLKSKLWWLGFCLMNIGECGNFISYGFAPASIVAPLGTFALIANCVFAPFIIGERFRKRDLLGIFIAIVGAITVVLSSNATDARLGADGLLRAIAQIPFIIYSCLYILAAVLLSALSQGSLAKKWVFVDVGLCAIFGGFTVLSTKAVSTLLTLEGYHMFARWITYPVIIVLIGTGIGQIRYLNRALMNFDSKVVIPIQFVLFNLSAIVGSAILFGDFRRAKFHQVVTFLYGCAATFCGVFIIAWSQSDTDSDSEYETEEPPSSLSPDTPFSRRDDSRLGGSLSRHRTALVLPSGPKSAPILRTRRSAISLLGISPAQHLLLVHTPPREPHGRLRDLDGDRDPLRTPDSAYRRRTISWVGEENRSGAGTRDSSLLGRRLQRSGTSDGVTNTGRSPGSAQ